MIGSKIKIEALVLHDGERWYAKFIKDGVIESFSLAHENGKLVPQAVTDWLNDNSCRKVRLVIPNDTQPMNVEVDHELNFEENHEMILEQSVRDLVVDGDDVRIAFRASIAHELNGEDHITFGSAFSVRKIELYIQQFKDARITLTGISSLQFAVLAWYGLAERSEVENLLFFTKKVSFGVIPGGDTQQIMLRTSGIGYEYAFSLEDGDHVQKRVESMLKHFTKSNNCIVVCSDNSSTVKSIEMTFGGAHDRSFMLEDILDEIVSYGLKSKVCGLREPIPFILLAPLPEDPRKEGTRICLFFIFVSLIACSFLIIKNAQKIHNLSSRIEAKSLLGTEREIALSNLDGIRDEFNRHKAILGMTENKNILDSVVLPVFTAIATTVPNNTKVIGLSQQSDKVSLAGQTPDQNQVTEFINKLRSVLAKQSIIVNPEAIKYNSSKQVYYFNITFKGGSR